MRVRQTSGPQLGGLDDGPAFARAPMLGQASLHDDQIGRIFLNMRLSLKASRDAIARRLAINAVTLDAFEAGAISALPHWKETVRIVHAYCELLRLDPEPILWRIRNQMQVLAAAQSAPPAQPGYTSPVAEGSRSGGRRHAQAPVPPAPRRRRRHARGLALTVVPLAMAGAVVYLAHMAPRPAYRVIAMMPAAIEVPLRTGMDYLMVLTAPDRDGLKWVDVGDPKTRKADKLQPSQR